MESDEVPYDEVPDDDSVEVPTSCEDMQDLLLNCLESYFEEELRGTFASLQTYEEAGLLTSSKGVVASFGGTEFQITIVRSR